MKLKTLSLTVALSMLLSVSTAFADSVSSKGPEITKATIDDGKYEILADGRTERKIRLIISGNSAQKMNKSEVQPLPQSITNEDRRMLEAEDTQKSSDTMQSIAANDTIVDVMQYLDFKQGYGQIEQSYKVVLVSGSPATSLSVNLGLYSGSTRYTPFNIVSTLSDTVLGSQIKVGKTGSKTINIPRTDYYVQNATITICNQNGCASNKGSTQTFLANKQAKLYPYYQDPVSYKVMTEPSSTRWLKTTPIEWTTQDRANYIKQYSELYPNNGYDWSGSVINIHHIKPREYGGTNDFDNLIPIPTNFHVYVVNSWWAYY
ncbi:HNH endonuclease [Paenibacillus sp. P25]|nr:HNH endonuclease [Paenibacillus sp. P25]